MAIRTLTLLAILLVSSSWADQKPLPADSWPQLGRTAQRTGDNPEATLTLPLRRVTAIRFAAPLYASPVVVGERVYIQDARGHVACIDRTANRPVWTATLG